MRTAGWGRGIPVAVVGLALACGGGDIASDGPGLLPEPPPGGESGGDFEALARDWCAAEIACVGGSAAVLDECVSEALAEIGEQLAAVDAACRTAALDYYGCLVGGMVCRLEEGEPDLVSTANCRGPEARLEAACTDGG